MDEIKKRVSYLNYNHNKTSKLLRIYISFDSLLYKILYVMVYFVFEGLAICHIIQGHFQQVPIDLGFHFQNCKHFLEYSGFYLLTTVYMKKQYWEFLFIYFHSYNNKSKLFCKMLVLLFSSNIPLYIEKKSHRKKLLRFWKQNLKCTPQSAQNQFWRKSYLKFCIIFNMISFASAQGSVKIRLACSKVFY